MDKTQRNAIETRLAKISKENNKGLTPDAVINDAKNKNSPLHSYFDWDNDSAGHKFRIEQARTLIRSFRVEIITNERTVSVVRYIRNPEIKGNDQGYVETAKVRSAEETAYAAFSSEMTRLGSIIERTESLADVLGFQKEFDKFKRSFVLLSSKVKGMAA